MAEHPWTSAERSRHWDGSYAERGSRGVSWFQPTPSMSLELIDCLGVGCDAAVLDVGAGGSLLVDGLVARGFGDVSVLDVSGVALDEARRRVGTAPVEWLHEDVLGWQPGRRYDLWHDRAVFHFLVARADREAYLRTLHAALGDGGCVVLATFAPDGPERCSGLPVARYAAPDLAALLGTTFELLHERREEHRTPGGAVQPFTWIAGRVRAS